MPPERTERWPLPHPGVRLQATLVATAVVTAALVAGGAILVLLVYRSLVGSVDAAGLARAHDVAALATGGRLGSTVASTGEETSLVQVVDAANSVLAASSNVAGESALVVPPPAALVEQVFTRNRAPLGDQGQSFRVVAEPSTLPDGRQVWIYVATSLAQIDLTTTRLAALLAAGLPVLLVIVAVATWRAVGRALRPVERIRATAAGISAASAGARLPVPRGSDEIARLTETMNGMLARIEAGTERERRFVGDASHELRSPLASLQTEVQVALAHPDQEPTSALLTRLSDQLQRMTDLTDALLFLARSDEGAPRGDETVDLEELVLDEAARLRATGVTVAVRELAATRLTGSALELSRLLRNLGDNAAAHARSTVTLSLQQQQCQTVLTVADDGPGIPAGERERVFERFTRLDGARSRQGRGGAGLGLAICRQIVQRHAGRISVEDGPGAVFVVRLPLPQDRAGLRPPETGTAARH